MVVLRSSLDDTLRLFWGLRGSRLCDLRERFRCLSNRCSLDRLHRSVRRSEGIVMLTLASVMTASRHLFL